MSLPIERNYCLLPKFKGRMLFDAAMNEYTSLKIGGPADVIAFPMDENDLEEILNFADAKGFPVFFLGAGTNLLVKDKGVRGIVVSLRDGFRELLWNGDEIIAGAGVKLANIVNECAKKGLSGLEWAIQIPGTIGGAVVMNAGAYGGEIKDVVQAVDAMDIKGNKRFVKRDDIGFSYRKCEIPSEYIITKVHLKLRMDKPDEIEKRIDEFKKKRQNTSDIKLPNAGSIFKNPPDNFAGRLIEEAGFKGKKVGGAMVSDVHANCIVNTGNAKASDVAALMDIIKERVFKERGIVLEPEIKIVGEE